MPTYEYSCHSCGTYDVEQRITEPPLKSCPTCGAPTKRLISRTSFSLKGGGWYSDGYASNKGNKSEASAPGSCAASGGGCGGGACGKPAAEA